jgi:hypothetical protein
MSSYFPAAVTNKLPPGSPLMNTGAASASAPVEEGVTKKRTRFDQAADEAEAAVEKAKSTGDDLKIAVAKVAYKLALAEKLEAKVAEANEEVEEAKEGDVVAAKEKVQRMESNHAKARVAWAEARVEALNIAKDAGNNDAGIMLKKGLGGENFPEWITAAENAVQNAKDDLKELRLAHLPAQVSGAASASVAVPEYSLDDLIRRRLPSTWPSLEQVRLEPFELSANHVHAEKVNALSKDGSLRPLYVTPGKEGYPCMLFFNLVEDEIKSLEDMGIGTDCVVLLAPSGAGKTRKLFRLLIKRYGLYISYKRADDKNYGSEALYRIIALLEGITNMRSDITALEEPDQDDLYLWRREVAEMGVLCVIYAYIVVFLVWFRTLTGKDPAPDVQNAPTPMQWLLLQLFPKIYLEEDLFAEIAVGLFNRCYDVGRLNRFDRDFSRELSHGIVVCTRLIRPAFKPRLCVVIDEAQMLSKGILKKAFRSIRNSNSLRPLLSPFLHAINSTTGGYPIIAGTGLTLLEEFESVESVYMVQDNYIYITFPSFEEITVRWYIDTFLVCADQDKMEEAVKWLKGRPRATFEFVVEALKGNGTKLNDLLNSFVQYMTCVPSSRITNPLTPGQAIDRLWRAKKPELGLPMKNTKTDQTSTKATITETQTMYHFLKYTFLLSCGRETNTLTGKKILKYGLGFVVNEIISGPASETTTASSSSGSAPANTTTGSSSSSPQPAKRGRKAKKVPIAPKNLEILEAPEVLPEVPLEVRPEPLLLEAAIIVREKGNFLDHFLSEESTPSGKGFAFESVAAFTFMRYFSNMPLEENPLLSGIKDKIPDGFKGRWIPFSKKFGMYAPSRRYGDNVNGVSPENQLFFEWFDNCMNLGESKCTGMLFPSNLAGPDTCMAFYREDDPTKVLFVVKQTKFAQNFDYNDAIATIDPKMFFVKKREVALTEMEGKTEIEQANILSFRSVSKGLTELRCSLIQKLTERNIPIVRVLFSGATEAQIGQGKGKPKKTQEVAHLVDNGRINVAKQAGFLDKDLLIVIDPRNVSAVLGDVLAD